MKTRPEKIMVVGLDSDGYVLLPENEREPWDRYLSIEKRAEKIFEANKPLFAGIQAVCADRAIDRFYFLLTPAGLGRDGYVLSGALLQQLIEKMQQASENSESGYIMPPVDYDTCIEEEPHATHTMGERYHPNVVNKYFNRNYDHSKFSIVYTQIHRIATRFPEACISYYFADAQEDIQKSMYNAFNRHAGLIPRNVKIHLLDYLAGDENVFDKKMHFFPATGDIDSQYSDTLKKMWRYALGEGTSAISALSNTSATTQRLADLLVQEEADSTRPLDCFFEKNGMELALRSLRAEFSQMHFDQANSATGNFTDALTALHDELQKEIAQPTPDKAAVIALANETCVLLTAIRNAPGNADPASADYFNKSLAAYEDACQKAAGYSRFNLAVGAVVATGLVFSGGLWMYGIATAVTSSLVAGGTGAIMMHGFFKPSKLMEKTLDVLKAGRAWSNRDQVEECVPEVKYPTLIEESYQCFEVESPAVQVRLRRNQN